MPRAAHFDFKDLLHLLRETRQEYPNEHTASEQRPTVYEALRLWWARSTDYAHTYCYCDDCMRPTRAHRLTELWSAGPTSLYFCPACHEDYADARNNIIDGPVQIS